jgi:hypothetical protein
MKPQVAETIWLPYPKNKPEKEGYYLTQLITNRKEIQYWNKQHDPENGFWQYVWTVLAFAELPEPYDPEAKTVNFATALLRMKGGCFCKSLSSNKEYRLQFYDDPTCYFFETYKGNGVNHPCNPDVSEIEGQWREVTNDST